MKKILYGFLVSLFLIQNGLAAVPNTFTEGTVASAVSVNENFNYFEGKFSITSGHAHTGTDSKSLATLGTITTGVWQGTIIDTVYGGTGLSSYASGDLVYATSDSTGALKRLAKPSTLGSVLLFGATNSEPEWLVPGTSGKFLQTKGAGANPVWDVVGSFKVGSFTRDTTVASGTQAVTGVGFTPKAVIFFMGQGSTYESSWGFDDSVTFSVMYSASASTYNFSASFSIYDDEGGGVLYTGKVTTLDTDGFTITWARTNAPTGTIEISYLALR